MEMTPIPAARDCLTSATPVSQTDRIQTLDLLRGFAILGILLINIWIFALPFPAALNPRLVGFDSVGDRAVYAFVHLLAYTKTMPIFSMLFGAGILLFCQRLESRGLRPAPFFVRRELWLLAFGLVHAYLIWDGDILVPYAVVGLILYRFRHRRARALLILALVAMVVSKGMFQVGASFIERMQREGQAAQEALEASIPLNEEQVVALERYTDRGPRWNPSSAQMEEIVAKMQGGYRDIVAEHAPETFMMHVFFYPMLVGWDIAGYMLIGMVLFKTGILAGERPPAFYRRLAALCYGVGLPLSILGLWIFTTRWGSQPTITRLGMPLISVAGPLVGLGHIALLILAWHRGWLKGLQSRLRAAGRMAFSNYISQSLIGTTLFYGWGLGLFGSMHRPALLGVVVAIWVLQLWWSPLWLRHFRFGPLEWAWRSLTYRSRQPFRRPPQTTPAVAAA